MDCHIVLVVHFVRVYIMCGCFFVWCVCLCCWSCFIPEYDTLEVSLVHSLRLERSNSVSRQDSIGLFGTVTAAVAFPKAGVRLAREQCTFRGKRRDIPGRRVLDPCEIPLRLPRNGT